MLLFLFPVAVAMAVSGDSMPFGTMTTSATNQFLASPQSTELQQVPFVGCESDGLVTQPQPAPKGNGKSPVLPRTQAQELAYYADGEIGVLAPRGWHCVGLLSSNGSFLFVTPEAHGVDELMASSSKVVGPVVQFTFYNGETDGRDDVAEVMARLFPAKIAFVRKVMDMTGESASSFPRGPYPHDVVTRLSAREVEFVTPAHRNGMGTAHGLPMNADPIEGVAILAEEGEVHDLVLLDVRLPPDLRHLIPAIINQTRHQ